jgi:hypothetical protein
MWVNPGITVPPCSSAILIAAVTRPFMPSTTSRTMSLRYILKSVATWSLRLLPVCSLPPAGPIISVRRNSTLVCMSSRPGSRTNLPFSRSSQILFRPPMTASASSAGIIPQALSILAWAREPMTA